MISVMHKKKQFMACVAVNMRAENDRFKILLVNYFRITDTKSNY